MIPPAKLNVIDRHGGFTIESKPPRGFTRWNMQARTMHGQRDMWTGDSLWRPGAVLRRGTVGTLRGFDAHSFFQTNNDVTKAIYQVPGYGYPVLVWFDNVTGERIA